MPEWAVGLGGRRLQPNELSIPFSPQVPARFASGFVLTVPVMDTTIFSIISRNDCSTPADQSRRILSSIISTKWIASSTSSSTVLESARGRLSLMAISSLTADKSRSFRSWTFQCAVVRDDPPLMSPSRAPVTAFSAERTNCPTTANSIPRQLFASFPNAAAF